MLNDEQMLLLMAHADGELDGAESAQVEALLRTDEQAQQWVDGFSAAKLAVQSSVVNAVSDVELAPVSERTREQTEAVQVMAWVDGELAEVQLANAQIETLIANSKAARTWADDLRIAKKALHDEVMRPATDADLSTVRGRVMRKLPIEPRPAVAGESGGLFPAIAAWLADLGLGKTVMAAGALAAVLLGAIALNQMQPPQDASITGDGPVISAIGKQVGEPTLPADGEPEVIIEDMESDGGTVIFEGGNKPGEPVIIWHIDAIPEGAG